MRKILCLSLIICISALCSNCSGFNRNDTAYIARATADSIPAFVFEKTNLKVLSIRGSDCDYVPHPGCYAVREIPPAICKLQQLEELRLNVNAIAAIPPEITCLKKLKVLDLSDNPALNDIRVLTTLSSLQELYLYGCYIEKIPPEISKLKNLKKLGLAGSTFTPAQKQKIQSWLPNCEIIW